MNESLNPDTRFLSASELLEAASLLDALHKRTIKTLDRLQAELATRKAAIAKRWKGVAGINTSLQVAGEASEVKAVFVEIRENSLAEFDAIMKDVGAAYQDVPSQREFYASPVLTLNRATLGDPRRTQYIEQLRTAGRGELAHLAQWAVSTGNAALAAAIVSRVDSMPSGQRPFPSVAVAECLRLEEHRKAIEAIKIADARFKAIVIAIRTWKTAQATPVNTVSLALLGRTLDEEMLRGMERDNAGAR